MTDSATPTTQQDLWSWVEDEKRLDRKVRSISYYAWSTTIAVVLVYAGLVLVQAVLLFREYTARGLPFGRNMTELIFPVIMPLVWVVGALSLLIAVLSTVGVLLRFRTASLSEIQLRLASMEAVLATDDDNPGGA